MFDASGQDIERDFVHRTGCFYDAERVALTEDQIEKHDLPEQMGKTTDSRAGGFVARHGRLVQVELDALPPDVLRGVFADAIERCWDTTPYEAVVQREAQDAASLGVGP